MSISQSKLVAGLAAQHRAFGEGVIAKEEENEQQKLILAV